MLINVVKNSFCNWKNLAMLTAVRARVIPAHQWRLAQRTVAYVPRNVEDKWHAAVVTVGRCSNSAFGAAM